MITIGITTFNRKNVLERMASSFYSSNRTYPYHVRIYDDCSAEYNKDYLRSLFPDASSIYVHDHNLGADGNMRFMYEDFLQSDDEFFFNADSDLIFTRDWMEVLMEAIHYSDGVVSGFRSNLHKDLCAMMEYRIPLVMKADLGAAGTLFTRDNVKGLLTDLKEFSSGSFDWKWSDCLKRRGIQLYSVAESVVQHIGVIGQNSRNGFFDYGVNFSVDSILNGKILDDTLMDISCSCSSDIRGSYYVFPFDKVRQSSKVIIYGNGRCSKDYQNQIKKTNYCDIVAVCDENYSKMDNTISPKQIEEYNVDFIIIAIVRDDISEVICNNLLKRGFYRDQIITISSDYRVEL